MSYRTDRVRLVSLFKRKPGMTREEFQKYWASTHREIFTSLEITKKNLLKYEQAHTSDAALKQMAEASGVPMADSEWDGMAIFEAESYDKILEIFQSEEYQKTVNPDADKFLDRPKCQLLPLSLVTVIDK
ncbi:EthD domain-containing protein [Favolaschia claudopus]|uniref:EthD domain-containing protein n=1 Tax=Favolaschia claudopus TaxID=2862362 RepID=A0AAW0C2Q4_9AGAR